MSVRIECQGTIKTFKGDQCDFTIDGFPTEDDYTAYFGVFDDNFNQIGPQFEYKLDYKDFIHVKLGPEFTSLFEIPQGENFATYYWGLKLWSDSKGEHTLQLFSTAFGQKLKFIVYNKRLEGPREFIERN